MNYIRTVAISVFTSAFIASTFYIYVLSHIGSRIDYLVKTHTHFQASSSINWSITGVGVKTVIEDKDNKFLLLLQPNWQLNSLHADLRSIEDDHTLLMHGDSLFVERAWFDVQIKGFFSLFNDIDQVVIKDYLKANFVIDKLRVNDVEVRGVRGRWVHTYQSNNGPDREALDIDIEHFSYKDLQLKDLSINQYMSLGAGHYYEHWTDRFRQAHLVVEIGQMKKQVQGEKKVSPELRKNLFFALDVQKAEQLEISGVLHNKDGDNIMCLMSEISHYFQNFCIDHIQELKNIELVYRLSLPQHSGDMLSMLPVNDLVAPQKLMLRGQIELSEIGRLDGHRGMLGLVAFEVSGQGVTVDVFGELDANSEEVAMLKNQLVNWQMPDGKIADFSQVSPDQSQLYLHTYFYFNGLSDEQVWHYFFNECFGAQGLGKCMTSLIFEVSAVELTYGLWDQLGNDQYGVTFKLPKLSIASFIDKASSLEKQSIGSLDFLSQSSLPFYEQSFSFWSGQMMYVVCQDMESEADYQEKIFSSNPFYQ